MGYGSRGLEGPVGTGEGTPLTTTPSFTFEQGVTPYNINTPINTPTGGGFILPQTLQQGSLGTGTLDPAAKLALAKSGNIDTTEVLASRRT